jgi:hypothetical protein
MNRLSCWKVPFAMSAVLVASLISGCKDCNDHGDGGGTGGAGGRTDGSPPDGPQEHWPEQVNVGPYATPYAVAPTKAGNTPCPPTGGWTPLPPTNGSKDGGLRPQRAGIDGFCVYKWDPRKLPRKLPEERDFKDIDGKPQHAVLGTSGPPDAGQSAPTEVYELLQKRFEKKASGFAAAGVERLKALAARPAAPGQAAARAESATAESLPPVKVAIVDATPRKLGMTAPDRSGHGYAVSRVVGTLACADPNSDECTRRVVVPYLALPIVGEVKDDFTEDWDRGGRAGTMVQLYDALDDAIEEWGPHRDKQHLVINLSLGWDPIKLDPNDPSVARIQTLLERAWCLGALIVAAAGNFTGSPGPIYPAAFESLPAPNTDRCRILAPPAGPKLTVVPRISNRAGQPYAPLVHSVGAVDANDKRTLVNRRWGQPRLSALGVGVTVPGPPGMPFLPPAHGTSMSAAIVSGIAARVWAAQPRLDAAGVMKAIYAGGVELTVGKDLERPQTEYCMGEPYGPCVRWPVHRAYLCGAMGQAIPGLKATCDQTLPSNVPVWPHQPLPSRPAAEKCTLTECGIPFGPMENQLAAAVGGHGYGSCDFCTFHVDSTGTITLNGTPRTTLTSMLGFTAVLNTNREANNPAVRIYPTYGVPFNDMPIPLMNPETTTAWITWTIQITSVFSYTYQTPLARI